MRREPAHERSGVRAGAHWPVDNARDGDPAAGNHPQVVAAANPAAAEGQVAACSAFGPAVGPASTNRIGRVLRRLVGWCRRAGSGSSSSSGPFDSTYRFHDGVERSTEDARQVLRAGRASTSRLFRGSAQEDCSTVGVLLTPGTSSGRAWDTTMVAAKGDQELDTEYVAFIRTQLDDSLRYPEDAPVAT